MKHTISNNVYFLSEVNVIYIELEEKIFQSHWSKKTSLELICHVILLSAQFQILNCVLPKAS